MTEITIGSRKASVSPTLFGLFLEDINFACDGGLNTNMVANHSFGGVYPRRIYSMIQIYFTKIWPGVKADRLRYWKISGGTFVSKEGAAGKSDWYAEVTVKKNCRLENLGFNGHGKHKEACAMGLRRGESYQFSCYLRSHNFVGKIQIFAEDVKGRMLTEMAEVPVPEAGWQQVECIVQAKETMCGKLVILFDGEGIIDIDCVIFSTVEYWGAGDPKWSSGHFRKDLVQALADLHPTFMRFPGGCIVEGVAPGNHYEWKKTVGSIIDREEKLNLWASGVSDKGYTQSNQIGFYEYFLLCEDLQMEPLPVVWAGMNCQARSKAVLPTDSEAFNKEVVQNALDLIDFANGDPSENKWAKIRADMGHPEPFEMKMIGIGNENFGGDYLIKFDKVKAAIDEKHPGMTCIMTAGGEPNDARSELSWNYAREKHPDVIVDEHFYKSVEWVMGQTDRYNAYERDTARVFLGEYAANEIMDRAKANTYEGALAEAAFLTGVERNSDVVALCSYAPLFCLADCGQWNHNLIFYNPYEVLKTVNYQVQQLFSTHQGNWICDISGQISNGIYLSVTEAEDRYIVKAVNTGEKDETLVIHSSCISEDVQIEYISHTDPMAKNTIDFYGKPHYEVVLQKTQSGTDADGIFMLEMRPKSVYAAEMMKGQMKRQIVAERGRYDRELYGNNN